VDTLYVQPFVFSGNNFIGAVPIKVKSASLALDCTWQPYCQATFVCVQPASSQLASIDPRNPLMLRFTLRQIADGVTTDQQWNLMVRARSIDWLSGEMTLTAASYDAQKTEYAAGGAAVDQATGGENMATIITGFDPLVWWPAGSFTQATIAGPSFTKADQVWQPGVTLADYESAFLDAGNARAWVDELGQDWLATIGWSLDSTTHYLNDATLIKSVADEISRDNPAWANYVVVVYQGQVTTATGGQQNVQAGSTPNQFRKALIVNRPGKLPSTGNAATKILNAATTRGRTLNITAVADITVRPNQTWSVAYGDQSLTGKVQSVSFQLPAGEMSMLVNV
jgi:hypothetical protein